MTDAIWLVVSKKGVVRISKGPSPRWKRAQGDIQRPRLAQGEYAVLIKVDVPDSAFKPIGLPTATITVPEAALVAPSVDVEVLPPPAQPQS